MTASSTRAALLGQTALFGGLGLPDREAIATALRPIEFETGQLIFSRGDPGQELYLVVEGRVRLSLLTGEGRELTLVHAASGEIFGEIAAFDGGPRTADATAIEMTRALVLPQPALARLIEANPRIGSAAVAFLCGRLRQTDHKLEAIALHSIEVRLARFLLSAIRMRPPQESGRAGTTLDLGMSQSELALLLGASRPKVNVALTRLEEAGALTRHGKCFACDVAVLKDIAGTEQ